MTNREKLETVLKMGFPSTTFIVEYDAEKRMHTFCLSEEWMNADSEQEKKQ